MYSRCIKFLGLVLLLAGVPPSLGKETNASRLKRGLPPLPPRFLSDKRATVPTTTSARPSRTPDPNNLNLDAGSGQDLRIQAVAGGEPFDLMVQNSKTPLYLGALAPHNLSKVTLSIVNKARRTTVSDKGLVQSTIWSMDRNTKELKARYVDPDGNKSPSNFAFDPHGNALLLLANVDDYNSANPDDPAIPVRLLLSED
ncbi:hypothetical protein DFH06DRAFT_1147235 [Mycena polygramma]|nr:hypothetical protein DFH06DRAFT_1147235 [Mycena polygramma]